MERSRRCRGWRLTAYCSLCSPRHECGTDSLHAAAQELIGPFEWDNAFEASNDTPDMMTVDQRGQPITPTMPEVAVDA